MGMHGSDLMSHLFKSYCWTTPVISWLHMLMSICLCRWDEMLYTIVVILLSIVMQAYILGTLNHYVVKKDAKLEAFR